MTRPSRSGRTVPRLLEQILAQMREVDAPLEERLARITELRGQSAAAGEQIDRWLLGEHERLRSGVEELAANQSKLREVIQKLSSAPFHEATYIGRLCVPGRDEGEGPGHIVHHGMSRHAVQVGPDVDPATLRAGDRVFLSDGLNTILASSGPGGYGETAAFERFTPSGFAIVKHRDEEIFVDATEALRASSPRPGDPVRFDRAAGLACEKVERSRESSFFLEDTPDVTFADVGGLDGQIEELRRAVGLQQQFPEVVKRYRLPRIGSFLLVGPPGTGKTMLARAFANWLAGLTPGRRSRFMHIPPTALHSVWFSQSERNYREVFRVAREAGAEDPNSCVVIFFDEVDAVAASRNRMQHPVDGRIVTTFADELNGLRDRGNIIVIAATNRRDALDPALARPGRLGDRVLTVPRPARQAARDIFSRHLAPDIPYHTNGNGRDASAERWRIIESATSRVFAPNGDGDLATVMLRDGRRHAIRAPDLVSGALIANIARTATERACLREIEGGDPGLRLDDVLAASSEVFETAAAVLTPQNCREYLPDLPRDVDVVDVQLHRRPAARSYRYMNVVGLD